MFKYLKKKKYDDIISANINIDDIHKFCCSNNNYSYSYLFSDINFIYWAAYQELWKQDKADFFFQEAFFHIDSFKRDEYNTYSSNIDLRKHYNPFFNEYINKIDYLSSKLEEFNLRYKISKEEIEDIEISYGSLHHTSREKYCNRKFKIVTWIIVTWILLCWLLYYILK